MLTGKSVLTGKNVLVVRLDSVGDVLAAVEAIGRLGVHQAVIFTSFHQDPLPAALMLRLAGVPHVTAACEDYPGTLLDVRHRLPAGGMHEVERMLSVAAAAGFPAPADTRLRLRPPPSGSGAPDVLVAGAPAAPGSNALPPGAGRPYLVLHPGASVPARAPLPGRCAQYADALSGDGWRVVVSGGPAERPLAAAVGTPVVSLFAPTVPAERWRPWGVPHVLLGAQDAPCAGTRARACPVPGHPCLAGVTADPVVAAVRRLAGVPASAAGPAARPLARLGTPKESA